MVHILFDCYREYTVMVLTKNNFCIKKKKLFLLFK